MCTMRVYRIVHLQEPKGTSTNFVKADNIYEKNSVILLLKDNGNVSLAG